MSSKSARKVKLPPPTPRALPVIEAETKDLCGQLGWLQYELEVKKSHLQQANQRLFNLNQEAAARKELDKPDTKEATNVQA